ncbi:UDP-N-acetylmuramoyl-tripeptide--D-alanyl-D-alanine ligase [Candidatus Peregrinibacteria bacterium]|nr:UDP-N-acetylmuramoyl-tripeptide--D-alanyl-D-alanine ligase [Candidatus Peregrinibacteria bacterium]
MRNFIKKLVFGLLVWLARIRLRRLKNVKIIGITGSAGKTTTKDAIAKVLSSKYRVIASKKSYNTEFGLPLTILGAEAGFSSAIMWLWNLAVAKWNAFFSRKKIDYFVLEMGVDKPGDMDLLTKIVKPDIAVFANVKPVHLAEGQFKNLDEIFKEKSKIGHAAKSGGKLILNYDDRFVRRLENLKSAKIIWYGFSDGAKVRATNIKTDLAGTSFDFHYGNIHSRLFVPILGSHHVNCVLPAIICGLECGMYIDDILASLRDFSLAPGRMNVIEGVNGSTIIDSSYNASPESTLAAMETLKEVGQGRRKIFVFGNMNELGNEAENYHKKIGEAASNIVDIFITVGELAKIAGIEAVKNEMPATHVHSFDNYKDATACVINLIKPNDIVLVKGSQNRVRLERLVKAIMRHPEAANRVLCRQEKTWQRIE